MDPERALTILQQVLITKTGLSVQDCAVVAQAWNVIAEAIKPKPQAEQKPNDHAV